jgi:hypothetical protein
MVSNLFCCQVVLMTLVWLCLMLAWLWPSEPTASPPSLAQPVPPPRKRSKEPKPLTVLTCKPPCAACEQASETCMLAPLLPRPKVTSTRGRQRTSPPPSIAMIRVRLQHQSLRCGPVGINAVMGWSLGQCVGAGGIVHFRGAHVK